MTNNNGRYMKKGEVVKNVQKNSMKSLKYDPSE